MRLGDIVVSAIWLSGEESEQHFKRFEADVRYAIDMTCASEGWEHGPLTFVEKRPGADQVPPVPDHIQGPNVRLLVAETEITGKKVESKPDSFVTNLERIDLMRLRKLTRKAHAKVWGGRLNDRECDEIIEGCGPDAALETLRRKDTLQ